MKNGNVVKSAENGTVTAEELAKINQYARKELSAEEVYVFPVILCDNDIDRDNECFSVKSLEEMAEKFIGVTGIFDHDPKGENQTARIFQTELDFDADRKTAHGETYAYLKAYAYMVRTEKNADLIKEIEGGIKKEVSVSCLVEKQFCSICGTDRQKDPCRHVKGRDYDGKNCYVTLDGVSDVYEWSFVAVPAQLGAGVTKGYKGDIPPENTQKGNDKMTYSYDECKKAFSEIGINLDEISKSGDEIPSMSAIMEATKSKFKDFKQYEEKAKLYDGLKSKAVDAAITNGIKAKGEAFDENRYRKLFESSTIEEINGWAADFEAEAKKSIAAGRTSEDADKSMNTLAYGNLEGYKI